MNQTMPQGDFYAKVRRGLPALIGQWLELGRGDADRLALILAETARVARVGEPGDTPDGETLRAWSAPGGGEAVPLWAARTATFLLVQMPARPEPGSEDEACAWAYCWLRNRDFGDAETARQALPDHLHAPLSAALDAAWADYRGLRLI